MHPANLKRQLRSGFGIITQESDRRLPSPQAYAADDEDALDEGVGEDEEALDGDGDSVGEGEDEGDSVGEGEDEGEGEKEERMAKRAKRMA